MKNCPQNQTRPTNDGLAFPARATSARRCGSAPGTIDADSLDPRPAFAPLPSRFPLDPPLIRWR